MSLLSSGHLLRLSGAVCRGSVLVSTVRSLSQLRHEGMEVTLTQTPRPKIHEQVKSPNDIIFGKHFSDHMLVVDYANDKEGWGKPRIIPFGDFSMSPALSAFHYSTECFEGLKAYHGPDGKIRMFRPLENMKRLNASAEAASLPSFDGAEFVECMKDLVRIDKDWVPKIDDCSLYIRPTFIGTEPSLGVRRSESARLYCITSPSGPYFASGALSPISLYADPSFVRAWPGGVGDSKMGGNYGPTIRTQNFALSKGCDQVLWLLGDKVTEVGTMNVFVCWTNENGEPEIATPPLDGTILPGVTRKSLIELAQAWGTHKVVERVITLDDICKAVDEGRLREMFGAGTACVVSPISRIQHIDKNIPIPVEDLPVAKRLYKELTDIQYGRVSHEWSVIVD